MNKNPDSKFHGANMGPIWVLPAPDGPHVGTMNLAIRELITKQTESTRRAQISCDTIHGRGGGGTLVADVSGITGSSRAEETGSIAVPSRVTQVAVRHVLEILKRDEIDGLVQERRNSSALAMELRLSCTYPSRNLKMGCDRWVSSRKT